MRLTRAPVVSIALIWGRATGNGSEIALACDMRFASREKAILSQFEVGVGLVAGGGPMARLPRLIGRGRALEVLLGADDIRGDLAELYGYVNRSLPDAHTRSTRSPSWCAPRSRCANSKTASSRSACLIASSAARCFPSAPKYARPNDHTFLA